MSIPSPAQSSPSSLLPLGLPTQQHQEHADSVRTDRLYQNNEYERSHQAIHLPPSARPPHYDQKFDRPEQHDSNAIQNTDRQQAQSMGTSQYPPHIPSRDAPGAHVGYGQEHIVLQKIPGKDQDKFVSSDRQDVPQYGVDEDEIADVKPASDIYMIARSKASEIEESKRIIHGLVSHYPHQDVQVIRLIVLTGDNERRALKG
jgi:hypothetical protein